GRARAWGCTRRPRSRRRSNTNYQRSRPPPGSPAHSARGTAAAPRARARCVVRERADRPAGPPTPACSAYGHRTRYIPSAAPPSRPAAAECCPTHTVIHRARRRSAFIPSKVVGSNPTPATTEIESLGQAQAFEHFGPLRGSRRPIEALRPLFHGRARDRREVLTKEGVYAVRMIVQQPVEVFETDAQGFVVHLDGAGGRTGVE